MKTVVIYTNDTDITKKTERCLRQKFEEAGFSVTRDFTEDAELIVSIGGDGTFLSAIHALNFPEIPFIGVNTGHLGFFQEISPEQLDEFICNFEMGRYSIQRLNTVKAEVHCKDGAYEQPALNEIVVKSADSCTIHLNISIGGSFIERFSGDGVLVSTAAGSTAYNYSLGGAIVDPRLRLLQLTPMAPMNTTAYRSFTSSILLPANLSLEIRPEGEKTEKLILAYDGMERPIEGTERIEVSSANREIKLLRFESYDFWGKIKSKFL